MCVCVCAHTEMCLSVCTCYPLWIIHRQLTLSAESTLKLILSRVYILPSSYPCGYYFHAVHFHTCSASTQGEQVWLCLPESTQEQHLPKSAQEKRGSILRLVRVYQAEVMPSVCIEREEPGQVWERPSLSQVLLSPADVVWSLARVRHGDFIQNLRCVCHRPCAWQHRPFPLLKLNSRAVWVTRVIAPHRQGDARASSVAVGLIKPRCSETKGSDSPHLGCKTALKKRSKLHYNNNDCGLVYPG